jgi:vanillate/3-O-methylgallate O-demethylase
VEAATQQRWRPPRCYVHTGLDPHHTAIIKRLCALKFFTEHSVSGFATFPVGACKHAILCNDDGMCTSP